MFADACLWSGILTAVFACSFKGKRYLRDWDLLKRKHKTLTHSLSNFDKTYRDCQIRGGLNEVEGDSCDAISTCYAPPGLNIASRWHINQYIHIFCRTFIRIGDFNLALEKNHVFENICIKFSSQG